MASVSLRKVRKVYPGGAVGVQGVDLEIRDGEFVVLVGPSGCGKSTTLRMVAGLEEISSGEISIGGRVVNEVLPKDRDIAMVFQNYALYPHMTVRENLAFGLKLRKVPKDEIERRIAEAAAVLGIEPYLDRRPKALSGGQRQRVAVGRAIVRNPAVFLFDEPLSNLDAKMRTQMRVEIKRLHAKLGATMIYVTHDQIEAMTMGDRIVVMEGGRIRQAGAPLEVYEHPADRFVAGFIGTPPMNFFEGRVERGAGGAPAFRFGAAILPLPDRARRSTRKWTSSSRWARRPTSTRRRKARRSSRASPPAPRSAAAPARASSSTSPALRSSAPTASPFSSPPRCARGGVRRRRTPPRAFEPAGIPARGLVPRGTIL